MPRDEGTHPSERPTLIRTPDQLQQAKRPKAPETADRVDQRREASDALPQEAGILGQLRTERAHD